MAVCGQTSEERTQNRHPTTNDSQSISVMLVCDEWKSSKGGLSTFNRELAVNLARTCGEKFKVYCYVSNSDEPDRKDAEENGVTLLAAGKLPGNQNRHDWLKIPPTELPNPDVVIGHGRKFGQPAYFITRMTNAKWVQFLHVFCEELGKYKISKSSETRSAVDTIHENELKHKDEIELCEHADAVVAVGSGLQEKYTVCLPDTEVEVITPGIIESFSVIQTPQWRLNSSAVDFFSILVCGRAAQEDRHLKGYDIIADAVAHLGEQFKLTFVGSPPQEQKKLEKWFLKKTKITLDQLTIHSYVDQEGMKRKFKESNLFVLSSRIEGFGFVALEAISAAIPVLISKKAGIAKALHKVEGGNSVIVPSDDPLVWAERIRQLFMQKTMERHENAILLREKYKSTYSWETECKKFSALIENLDFKGM